MPLDRESGGQASKATPTGAIAKRWRQGCENRFKQLVKKVGLEKAEQMLQNAEQGFKENCALVKKLSEM